MELGILCKLGSCVHHFILQGSQQQEMKFQDQMFSKFQDILRSQKSHYVLLAQISHEHQQGHHYDITKAILNQDQ